MIDFACKHFNLMDVVKCSLGLSKADLEVLKLFLKKRNEKLSADDISKKLKINLSTSQRSVKKLFEKGILKRTQMNLVGGGYTYNYQTQEIQMVKKQILNIVQNWVKKVEEELEQI